MDIAITSRRGADYIKPMGSASVSSPCLSIVPIDVRTRHAQDPVMQARPPHACVLHECARQQVSTIAQPILEAEVQHTFERLIVGRSIFRKSWRLWVMRELFKIQDGLLSTQVRGKLITYLKDTHYS